MYQNISRKFRPQTFGNIVGQDAIVTTLKNAIKLGKIAPAYLFCGCRGTGKTTLARLFAKALNCYSLQENMEPCNVCPSCLSIMQGKSLDVMEIDGASNRGIDDIRQINETVGYAATESKYKIYIIDEVHMLTKEAFNALLKTLEEPPSTVKFFFATTEPHKVLATIISRCQRFDLHRLAPNQIVHKLQQIATDLSATAEPEALQLVAHLAEGGLRDAESLFDQLLCYTNGTLTYDETAQILGISPRSLYFRLDRAIASYHLTFAFELAAEIFSSGKDFSVFLDGLIEHYRTIMLLKFQLPPASPFTEKDRQEYVQSASFYTQEHCLYILDYLMHWYKEIHRTPFKRVTLEMILLHLIRSQKRISLPQLVRRLEELEIGSPPPRAPTPSLETCEVPPMHRSPSAPFSEKTSSVPAASALQPTPQESALKKTEPAPIPSFSVATPLSEKVPLASQAPEGQPTPQEAELVAKEPKSPPLSVAPSAPETPPFAKHNTAAPQPASPTPVTPTKEPAQVEKKLENDRQQKSRYDTLLRFAAVELEGTIKRE